MYIKKMTFHFFYGIFATLPSFLYLQQKENSMNVSVFTTLTTPYITRQCITINRFCSIPTLGMIRSHAGNPTFPRWEQHVPLLGISIKKYVVRNSPIVVIL